MDSRDLKPRRWVDTGVRGRDGGIDVAGGFLTKVVIKCQLVDLVLRDCMRRPRAWMMIAVDKGNYEESMVRLRHQRLDVDLLNRVIVLRPASSILSLNKRKMNPALVLLDRPAVDTQRLFFTVACS